LGKHNIELFPTTKSWKARRSLNVVHSNLESFGHKLLLPLCIFWIDFH